MKRSLNQYEEMTFSEFVMFVKTYSKQLEENINIYLNLDSSIIESDRIATEMLLDSFLQLFTHSKVEHPGEDGNAQLHTWLMSQLAILSMKSFNLFQLVFEKSLITLLIQIKHHRSTSIVMYSLSVFTYLVYSYNHCNSSDQGEQNDTKSILENKSLDKLNKLLIGSPGVQNLAFILKKCEEWFQYKRCVFYAYVPWSNEFYGVVGTELQKVQSMRGHLGGKYTVFSAQKPIFLKDPTNYINEDHIQLFGLSSVIFIPIVHEEQLFGWLTFDQMGEVFDCTSKELALLEQIGIRLGLFFSRRGEALVKNSDIHLTEREHSILMLLAEGNDNKRIAKLLFLSEHTIRDYVSSLMKKLKAKNRTQVVASAFRKGFIQ
ncbi:LuxR C-terminal-related transcriptional regulator [Cytobacillus purgationiresistens]|uniref:DNA-binding CsgD family transcriptional regulator n=1 Tax=Cytobacillus purgationiresistens TaxID=863449 RepID=A0ABU0AEM5_9BACI|nr:LuxR C-terminal-related transcriptional regulator [Cytobacillus purgationiresistens]MDQ0269701.1 DNA-binding CsgD family transcriptional regulator [Cytobacillus purgationiresistens]